LGARLRRLRLPSRRPGKQKVAILFNDISARKAAEEKVLAQLARLALLNQITLAIASARTWPAFSRVVVGTLEEEMPVDFGCICTLDALDGVLTVTCIGTRSAGLAAEARHPEQARITIESNGLGRCLKGELVYEPDISDLHFPFTEKLARVACEHSWPRLCRSKAASSECSSPRGARRIASAAANANFCCRRFGHVALAAHQAETHAALQQAYQDLRQTQQAVMQQETPQGPGRNGERQSPRHQQCRLARGDLHRLAAGAGNAAEPERPRNSCRSSNAPWRIVAATVARMREFYRHREPELALVPVTINAWSGRCWI